MRRPATPLAPDGVFAARSELDDRRLRLASKPLSTAPLPRRVAAEGLGTAWLTLAVVGSGIAAQRLSPATPGLELLENSLATAAALVFILLSLTDISGAHLNPAVTLADHLLGGLKSKEAAAYVLAQLVGAATGAVLANVMFGLAPIQLSTQPRFGVGVWLGELVATFGLVLVVFTCVRAGKPRVVPIAVAAYIASAYWFTASTSFANPALTLARTLSNTFTGISPASLVPFLLCEGLGALAAAGVVRVLTPGKDGGED